MGPLEQHVTKFARDVARDVQLHPQAAFWADVDGLLNHVRYVEARCEELIKQNDRLRNVFPMPDMRISFERLEEQVPVRVDYFDWSMPKITWRTRMPSENWREAIRPLRTMIFRRLVRGLRRNFDEVWDREVGR